MNEPPEPVESPAQGDCRLQNADYRLQNQGPNPMEEAPVELISNVVEIQEGAVYPNLVKQTALLTWRASEARKETPP